MDGVRCLRKLHDLSPATRLAIMTGHCADEEHREALASGAFRVLCKPFKEAELLAALN